MINAIIVDDEPAVPKIVCYFIRQGDGTLS